MPKVLPELKSAPCIKKLDKPILTSADLPYESMLVFNAGVVKFNGKYIMVFRNDYGTTPERYVKERHMPGTSIGVAVSDNGIDGWQVRDFHLMDNHRTLEETGREFRRFYDPRVTIVDGKPYVCMALDTKHGVRGAVAELDDNFETVNILSISAPESRNMVLFPEKIGGKFVRLERPMWGGHHTEIWCSKSPDLRYWGETELVIDDRTMPFTNDKIGPGAPPIKTDKGWLTTFHAVDVDESRTKNGWEDKWVRRYTGGLMLLDLENPSKIVAMSKKPLIAPDMPYETDEGFRHNVIFPGGMILEDDGEVKIYYGASDTYECLATAHVDDLVKLCLENNWLDEQVINRS